MTQDAIVTKIIDRRTAEVEVERGTACGGTCSSCEACVFQNTIRTTAYNRVSALPGQRVVIESRTSQVLGAAALLASACALKARRQPRERKWSDMPLWLPLALVPYLSMAALAASLTSLRPDMPT